MKSVKELKSKYYDSVPGWIDGTSQYMALVNKHIRSEYEVLKIGPVDGTGFSHDLKGKIKSLVGVDIDPSVTNNTAIDKAVIGPIENLPFHDNSFDIAVSSFALEHIDDSVKAAHELYRVLRPGGIFIFRAPNLWHYTTMGAKLTPHWFHKLAANRLCNKPANSGEHYPATFRCNTRKTISSVFDKAGFSITNLNIIEPDPSYMRFNPIAFRLGVMWERFLNSNLRFEGLRATILGVLDKPAQRSDN